MCDPGPWAGHVTIKTLPLARTGPGSRTDSTRPLSPTTHIHPFPTPTDHWAPNEAQPGSDLGRRHVGQEEKAGCNGGRGSYDRFTGETPQESRPRHGPARHDDHTARFAFTGGRFLVSRPGEGPSRPSGQISSASNISKWGEDRRTGCQVAQGTFTAFTSSSARRR